MQNLVKTKLQCMSFKGAWGCSCRSCSSTLNMENISCLLTDSDIDCSALKNSFLFFFSGVKWA